MKKSLIVLAVLIAAVVIGIFWWQRGLLPVDSTNKTSKIFVINKGEGVKEIANNLKKEGLIRDPIVFFILATRIKNLDKQIQAGDFRLNAAMNAEDIATALTHGTLDIWTTIPEGLRAEEIANILKEKIPSYQPSWNLELDKNEGYLFPDTYLIPRTADITLITTLMRNNFNTKYAEAANTKTTNLTEAQTMVIASIIEREAVFEEDRPLVASVIINRLGLGMPLGIDPTVQYAVGYDSASKSWWKKDLTVDDLAINSPYNTRKNVGLPPTPISNPGISAIKAALNPASSDYLFFFSDKKGHLHFATNLAGHEANIKKYE